MVGSVSGRCSAAEWRGCVGVPSVAAQKSAHGAQNREHEDAAVTKRAILHAARQLFAEQGFANATVKGLAERAGVAVQTIYATFGSKAG